MTCAIPTTPSDAATSNSLATPPIALDSVCTELPLSLSSPRPPPPGSPPSSCPRCPKRTRRLARKSAGVCLHSGVGEGKARRSLELHELRNASFRGQQRFLHLSSRLPTHASYAPGGGGGRSRGALAPCNESAEVAGVGLLGR